MTKNEHESDETRAGKVAEILGPSSAAAQALQELERRRAAGESNIGIVEVRHPTRGNHWLVGAIKNVQSRKTLRQMRYDMEPKEA